MELHLYRPDSRRSSEGEKNVRPPAAPRGTMLILATGSYSGMRAPINACPACAPYKECISTHQMNTHGHKVRYFAWVQHSW